MHRWLYITIALVVIGFVVSLAIRAGNNKPELITATVDTGVVEQLVSVSGVAKANQTAELAFPTGGIVDAVLVGEGDEVAAGQPLITLDARTLQADRQDAAAALARAIATRNELIAGPSDTARIATSEQVRLAEEKVTTTENTQARLIENAYRALLSGNLEAISTDPKENAVAPTVTGTYTCDSEGVYTLRVFSSASASGYSYNLSGLEFDTSSAFTEQSAPLGTCGLRIQFDATSNYTNSVWEIAIPNIAGASYTTNKNAYELAKTNALSALALAKQDLVVAKATESNTNAPARQEAIARANADVTAAQARLARVDATLTDRTLTAPFAGIVSQLNILPGETVGVTPVVTIVGDSHFEITARIPEIDVASVAVGQKAHIRFDAFPSKDFPATISRIAIEATEIDGVGYYETTLLLDNDPDWLRNGLNADVDIIVASTETDETNTLRIPKRFLIETADGYQVRTKQPDGSFATTTVDVRLIGNDGYVAITKGDMQTGDTLVAP